MRIDLLLPAPGDKHWRVRMTHDGHSESLFTTSIPLETETKRVVELLLRMHKRATVYGPGSAMIHPRPPGGYPRLIGQPPSSS